MHTESDAKKLWCPERGKCDLNGDHQYCIASGCAMWRWAYNFEGNYARNGDEPLGYCGLAGKEE